MKIDPDKAVLYCEKLINRECSLCKIGIELHKSEEGDYRHKITFKAMTVIAECYASKIWKFLKGETNELE